MTTAHHLVAWVVVGLSAGFLVATVWSWLAGRRSGGRADHRFAVDRIILGLLAVVGVAEVLGLIVLAGGNGPSDPLHLVYGVAALVAIPIAWTWAGRAARDVAVARTRRDAWLAVAATVMLGIELRLFMTG
jgi:hypothetical protein